MSDDRERPWVKQAADRAETDGAYCDYTGWEEWLQDVDPDLADAVMAMPVHTQSALYVLMATIVDGDEAGTQTEYDANVKMAIDAVRKDREGRLTS
jgi:hypothetical protein